MIDQVSSHKAVLYLRVQNGLNSILLIIDGTDKVLESMNEVSPT